MSEFEHSKSESEETELVCITCGARLMVSGDPAEGLAQAAAAGWGSDLLGDMCPRCCKELDSQLAPAPEQQPASKPAGAGKSKAAAPAGPRAKQCLCGCGLVTAGGYFIPGHDAKLNKALRTGEKQLTGMAAELLLVCADCGHVVLRDRAEDGLCKRCFRKRGEVTA